MQTQQTPEDVFANKYLGDLCRMLLLIVCHRIEPLTENNFFIVEIEGGRYEVFYPETQKLLLSQVNPFI